MITVTGDWYVLVVRPGKERLVAGHLANLAIGHSLRTHTVHRKNRKGGTDPIRLPVLPGYLPMVVPAGAIAAAYRDQAAEGCSFIKGLLARKADDVPLKLKADWEDRLRIPRELQMMGPIDYKPGDRVLLTFGAFAGLIADCEGITGNEVTVSMPMLNARRITMRADEAKRAA